MAAIFDQVYFGFAAVAKLNFGPKTIFSSRLFVIV